MNHRGIAALVLVLGLVAQAREAREKDNRRSQAAALLARAAEIADVQSPGSPPFRLRAWVEIFDSKQGPVEGKYELLWASPDQWRDEITFPQFTQVRVGGQGKLWEKRNVPYPSLRVWQFMKMWDFGARLQFFPDEAIRKIQQKLGDGKQMSCIQSNLRGQRWREVCFDPSTGVATEERYFARDLRYEYADYAPLGSRLFPQRLRIVEGKSLIVEVRVDELSDLENPEATWFVPPSGAQMRHWCRAPKPPEPVSAPGGSFVVLPMDWFMLATHPVIYGVIGTDGEWHDLRILEPGGNLADSKWLNLMRQQRFLPATCEGLPIEVEVVFRVGAQ